MNITKLITLLENGIVFFLARTAGYSLLSSLFITFACLLFRMVNILSSTDEEFNQTIAELTQLRQEIRSMLRIH